MGFSFEQFFPEIRRCVFRFLLALYQLYANDSFGQRKDSLEELFGNKGFNGQKQDKKR